MSSLALAGTKIPSKSQSTVIRDFLISKEAIPNYEFNLTSITTELKESSTDVEITNGAVSNFLAKLVSRNILLKEIRESVSWYKIISSPAEYPARDAATGGGRKLVQGPGTPKKKKPIKKAAKIEVPAAAMPPVPADMLSIEPNIDETLHSVLDGITMLFNKANSRDMSHFTDDELMNELKNRIKA